MNEITPINQSTSALAQVEQSRAIQEVQASLIIAQRFPRDEKRALDAIITACQRPVIASVAMYQYAKGHTDVSGPSIRMAETLARCWGNIESGFREISRGIDEQGRAYSEVEAYAWDLQTNTRARKGFTVAHWRDRKGGKGYAITDERDIYELVANQAQRRVRACILSLIPGDVIDDAMSQCEQTISASADVTPEGVKKLVDAFAKLGVSKAQIEARIQRRVTAITGAQVISLRKIYTSISDGMGDVSDWFDRIEAAPVDPTDSKQLPPSQVVKPKHEEKAKAEPEPELETPLEDQDDIQW